VENSPQNIGGYTDIFTVQTVVTHHHLRFVCRDVGAWLIVELHPSKRDVVQSLLTATDNETIEQDVDRDYNKLAPHPKGKFTYTYSCHMHLYFGKKIRRF